MEYLNRPQYHYKPQKGWINDPNGLVYFQGYYHLFYQHQPHFERPRCEAVFWGHARTKDFLTFEELPVALTPEHPYEKDGCWSGTAIVKDETLYLFYTGIRVDPETGLKMQTIALAYSRDGIHFKKYENNPIIDHFPSDGARNFRDPAITCINGTYYLVIASGNQEKTVARLLLYKSEDLFHWEYLHILGEWPNAKFAECPFFLPTKDGYFLATSICEPDRSFFTIMHGDFRNGVFYKQTEGCVDEGPDQYAGQAFLDPQGRVILLSWIPGWGYEEFAERDIGCMSLPREITLENGILRVFPIAEVQHLLKETDPALKRTATGFEIARNGRDPVVYRGEIRDLKLLRDEYLLEVFVNQGEITFTVLL
ncbi:MAG: glycoside hydrolase family 32 protein [Clostridia bacterium]|nr:glycoside hydrolase family 32 protein [Clostridia bacterium]